MAKCSLCRPRGYGSKRKSEDKSSDLPCENYTHMMFDVGDSPVIVSCSGQLSHILKSVMMRGGGDIPDIFSNDYLTRDIPDDLRCLIPIYGYQFVSFLEYSTWSQSFMHGADMLPGMIEGFESFLDQFSRSVAGVNKIRFKKHTEGDLVYSILLEENTLLQNDSNVFGSFIDETGKEYYFYAQDIGNFGIGRNRQEIFDNKLSELLLLEKGSKRYEKKFCVEKGLVDGDIVEYDLVKPDISQDMNDYYIQKISQNKGYLLSTIFDILNLTGKDILKKPGLVIGYQDVKRVGEFDVDSILNGSLKIVLQRKGDVKQMEGGLGYQYEFKLNTRKGEETVLSGVASFYIGD